MQSLNYEHNGGIALVKAERLVVQGGSLHHFQNVLVVNEG